MLKSSNWMVNVDERILEHLRDTDDELTAWELSVDLDAPRGLVRSRCHILAHAGFVHRRPREGLAARYEISMDGLRYLDGDLDADLIRPIPRQRPSYAVRPGWYAKVG